MKKLTLILVICLVFFSLGCQKNEVKQGEGDYNDTSKVEHKINEQDKDEITNNTNKNQNNSNKNMKKEKIDISSEKEIISLVLYDMYQNEQNYDATIDYTNLPQLAYSILNHYSTDECFIMPSFEDGESYARVSRDDANEYIKVATTNFAGDVLDNARVDGAFDDIMYYSSDDDMYYLMIADGAPWISIDVLDAYDNNDDTYTAKVNAYFESNGGDHEFIGKYKVYLIDNDSGSKFKYRIYDIKKL